MEASAPGVLRLVAGEQLAVDGLAAEPLGVPGDEQDLTAGVVDRSRPVELVASGDVALRLAGLKLEDDVGLGLAVAASPDLEHPLLVGVGELHDGTLLVLLQHLEGDVLHLLDAHRDGRRVVLVAVGGADGDEVALLGGHVEHCAITVELGVAASSRRLDTDDLGSFVRILGCDLDVVTVFTADHVQGLAGEELVTGPVVAGRTATGSGCVGRHRCQYSGGEEEGDDASCNTLDDHRSLAFICMTEL
jgi:hypothetical protein